MVDMLDQLILLDTQFVLVGDFNVPGVRAGQLDRHATDALERYELRQHIIVPTHVDGNTLDLILSQKDGGNDRLVSTVAVQSVCFSDHYLLTCHIGVPAMTQVTTTYTYRPLKKMNTNAFFQGILQSKLFSLDEMDADQYAELIDCEDKRVLDVHEPLRISRRRCS